MKDAPAFDFYPERWLVGTAAMTDAEQLAYLRLLCHQWVMDGLPAEIIALKRLAGRGVTDAVLLKFPAAEDGKRRNRRLEIVREEQRERIKSRRYGAAVTHLKRYGADSLSDQDKALIVKTKAGQKLLAEQGAQQVLSKPSARLEQGAQELACTLPPPTTHHPPQKEYTEPLSDTPRGLTEEGPSGGSGSVSIPPVTLEQAKQHGPSMGVPADAAESWWLDNDARGWVDRSGQSVRNWRSSLTAYGRRWQANNHRRGETSGSHAKTESLF